MGLDARVRYTKMVIIQSVCQLLQEEPFHEIKLTTVCNRAGIHRTTFYKYYKDLYDWKEQVEQECLQRISNILDNCTLSGMKEILTQQFSDMMQNAELYVLISSPNFESRALETVISMILEEADIETEKHLSLDTKKNYQRKWNYYFEIYGCLGVIKCWIENGMKESPEILAAYYFENVVIPFNQPKEKPGLWDIPENIIRP